ncbi:hypothetical protein CF319_g7632 [Tilletia indica]|nr:hypothetical protein CF319_g7632 [Tilletia indica]
MRRQQIPIRQLVAIGDGGGRKNHTFIHHHHIHPTLFSLHYLHSLIHTHNMSSNNAADDSKVTRHEEGKENSHLALDGKDEKSIANKLEAASKAEKEEKAAEQAKKEEGYVFEAEKHGNEPSRGAKIDAQIEAEEQAELERKGKA